MADVTTNQMISDVLVRAYGAAGDNQSNLVRHKGKILQASGGVLQVLQILAVMSADGPLWLAALLAGVIAAIQVVVTKMTPSAITESQPERILKEVRKLDLPELKHAGVLETLMNIADAVNNQRAKERGIESFGPQAQNEEVVDFDEEQPTPAPAEPLSRLDQLREAVSNNVSG